MGQKDVIRQRSQQYIQYVSLYNLHKHETEGFTIPLSEYSDAYLLAMSTISERFLNYCKDEWVNNIEARSRRKFRNEITYLMALRDMQGQAWERFMAQSEKEAQHWDRAFIHVQKMMDLKAQGKIEQSEAGMKVFRDWVMNKK